ncbi:spore coat associated protein CotJA [Clostridium sp.]|uniref:spore coat associated protein CotJA n=1 Tax=Clostridium sp. TaxID=1506 RepID=UPI001A4B325F|nr:spore coat associated protein CotJA [Clostridium sp.]MBK5234387.1 spore coat associated protein CotJA [Clostridium sp.]
MEQNESRKKTTKYSTKSNCIPQETEIKNVRLAAAYVPYQKLCTLFSPLEALKKGTVFPELYSPYDGEDKKRRPLESIKKGSTYEE